MIRTAHRTIQSDVLGFFGAIAAHVSDPATAFADTATMIARAIGCEPREVWPFLDSRHGRLFADDVAIELATGCDLAIAVGSVIERWQDWRMAGRGRIAKDGPFLAGTVQVEGLARRQLDNASSHHRRAGTLAAIDAGLTIMCVPAVERTLDNSSCSRPCG